MSLYTFSLNTNHSHLIVTTPTDVYALPYLGLSFGTPQGPSGDEQVTFFSNGLAMVAVRIMQSNLVGATWQLRIADLIANYLYMPVGSSAGSVTSVDVSGGTTGMTFTGGPITTAGVITMGGGPLNAAHGGTDNTSYTVGDILVATGATTLSKLAAGAAGTVLSGNGAGVAPTWQTNGAGSVTSVDVSGGTSGLTYTGGPITSAGTITLTGGSLVEGYGGTHQTTYAKGDILYASAANTLSKLAAGSNTQVLTLAAGVPSWAAPATSGTVTSVDVSGGTTGLTFSGGPITGSGTITEAGTLNETHGGTNQTTYTTGDILYASAANTLSKLAAGTSGYVLTMGASVPAWSPASGAGVRSLFFLTRSSEHAFSSFTGSCTCCWVYDGTGRHGVDAAQHRGQHGHQRPEHDSEPDRAGECPRKQRRPNPADVLGDDHCHERHVRWHGQHPMGWLNHYTLFERVYVRIYNGRQDHLYGVHYAPEQQHSRSVCGERARWQYATHPDGHTHGR